MLNLGLGKPAGSTYRVLCLGAHSDDIEIGCGGTIRPCSSATTTWSFAGSFSAPTRRGPARPGPAPTPSWSSAGEVRRREELPRWLLPVPGRPDQGRVRGIEAGVQSRSGFTHYRQDRHQDHRLISDLTWNTFRNHLILEYEIPKYDGDLGAPTSSFLGKNRPAPGRSGSSSRASSPRARSNGSTKRPFWRS